MRALVYYVAVTLDGFIADPQGRADFFPIDPEMVDHLNGLMPETVPTAFRPHAGLEDTPAKRFDTVLMGRATYEAGGVASPWRHLRQCVFSTTLAGTADDEVELVGGDPVSFVRDLKCQDGGDLWISGGGRLAGALLPEIDELIIKRYPLVAAEGVPVFAGGFRPRPFTLTGTRTFGNGASVSTYLAA
ncbi:dihydrofolate reductase family protein [Spirillospora sp. NPDC050679]